MIVIGGAVEELIVDEYRVVQGFVVRSIVCIHHGMNFKAELCTSRLCMLSVAVIKDEKQALIPFDVGIVASFGIVVSIAIYIDKRRKVLCIVTFAVGWPGEDVFGNFIASLAMMGDEVVDFLAGEVPDVMILEASHQADGGICGFERPCPIVLPGLTVSESGQM